MNTARRTDAAPALQVDVLVVGAGPAGSTTAAQLAGHCSVALAGRAPLLGPSIGETLPAAARVLLSDLGLWEEFAAQRHRPAWSRMSLWGDARPTQQDALFDPHGHGWHLDRARFDALLRNNAARRGAMLLCPAQLRAISHTPTSRHPWHCVLQLEGGTRSVHSRLLVDASGRAARVLRQAGVEVARRDRLVCLHTWLPATAAPSLLPGTTLVEATPQGWWYSADLPDGGSVIAWHTDSDLPGAKACRAARDLLALAHQTRLISQRCAFERPEDAAQPMELRVVPAHSQWASQTAGADWLAVGDAALAFDPLASQGLMNCLYTGLHAAQAVRQHLRGDAQALPAWNAQSRGIADAYRSNLARYYALEQRWPHEPFWRRRQQATA